VTELRTNTWTDWRGSADAAGLASLLALAAVVLRWRGGDLPAQLFRAELFHRYGFLLWQNQWYGGHSLLSYSVLAPALLSIVGPVVLGAVCGVVSAMLFDRLVRRAFGRASRLGSLWFAAGTVTNLAVGRVTFALGLTAGLAALLAALNGRWRLALVFGALCPLASPVAGVFLGLCAASRVVAQRDHRVHWLALGAASTVPIGVISILFPERNLYFPFPAWQLGWDLLVCIALFLAARRELAVLRWAALTYALVLVVTFVVPSPMGQNVSRLGQYAAGPLLVCALRRRRGLLLAALSVPLLFWQWFPAFDSVAVAGRDASTHAAYYAPLLDYLGAHPADPGRIEIPFTRRHWESAYVAVDHPLARGWERQVDMGYNPAFYDDTLTVATYGAWLRENAVRYVARPDAPLDPSSTRERAIIDSAPPYLHEVWRDAHWVLYAVDGYHGLVDGPATLVTLAPESFTVDVSGVAPVRVRVRASSHWTIADDGAGCVDQDADGWVLLRGTGPGRVTVHQTLGSSLCSR
jgi:hypothetical protein